MQASGASVQQGESIIGDALTEADEFQSMGSDSIVIVDPSGMGLTESSAARRGWKQHNVVVLGKKLDDAICGQRQFICSVTGLHLSYLDHQLECLPWDSMGSIHMVWELLRVDSCRWELPPTSSPYMTGHMPLVQKKVGDREALRYR